MNLRRVAKGVEKQLRIARVHGLACVRELAWFRGLLHLPRNDPFSVRSAQEYGVRVRLVDPEEPFERELPYMPGEKEPHWAFAKEQRGTFPATFVAEVEKGRFWGYYGGSVFTGAGHLIPELSKDVWGPDLHSAYAQLALPTPRRLPGRTLSLVTPEAAGNYHHWTMDLIPRAGLAERAGYPLRSFDQVLVKDRGLPYQKEAFARLGIEKVIQVSDTDHFDTDLLVVPAVRLDNTRVNLSDMRFTRRLYLPEEPKPQDAKRRLYVSRRDAAFRRVLNEPAMMAVLQEYGFEEVAMSKMSVAEQARVFAEASVILGPNGSALANLVFANSAAHVIELFAPGWVVSYNWMICANLGLGYTALIGEGPRPPLGTLPREIKQDMHIDLDQLRRALAAVPLLTRSGS